MAKRKSETPRQFEDALCELEAIARELEEGSIGLDESLQRFEQGIGLLRHCYGILDDAEKRISILTGVDDKGNPVLEPFDATATAEQGVVGRRKTSQKSAENSQRADSGDLRGGLF